MSLECGANFGHIIMAFHWSQFSVTKATLQSQMSVRLSVCLSEIKTPHPLRIKPICHYAYLLISQIPISHHANQPPCPPPQPLCQLVIIPIPISHHHAYWPLYLLAICPAFATSKPFRLVDNYWLFRCVSISTSTYVRGMTLVRIISIFACFSL